MWFSENRTCLLFSQLRQIGALLLCSVISKSEVSWWKKTKKAPIHKENDHLWSLDRRAAKCVITVPLYISDADINKSHCCVNWKLAPPISLTFFLHAQKSSRPHWRHFWIHYINPSRTTNERSAHERQQTHVCLVFLSEVILFYNVPLVHPRPTYTVSHRRVPPHSLRISDF